MTDVDSSLIHGEKDVLLQIHETCSTFYIHTVLFFYLNAYIRYAFAGKLVFCVLHFS